MQSISDLIRDTGFINLDFADVTAIMKNAGMAHMGVGRAAGKGKAEEAAKMAISSPLLETSIEGAKGVLINVTGSMDIGLEEVEQAASLVQQAVHPDALTIFGATFDETLDDEIRVTVIATGFDKAPEQLPKVAPVQTGSAQAPAEPMPLKEEDVPKPETAEDDPFEDIFKFSTSGTEPNFYRTCRHLPAGPAFLPPLRDRQSLPWRRWRKLQGVFFPGPQKIASPADRWICRPHFGKG